MKMTLNKFIAQAGIASRRKAVDVIKQGNVAINGTVETVPSYVVQPTDHVTFKGTRVKPLSKKTILLNKPKNCITTVRDQAGRPTVMNLLPDHLRKNLFPVGRLDGATTGLLIITNDGDLAQKLAHPRHEIQKVYRVTFSKPISPEMIANLRQGAWLPDGKIKPDWVKPAKGTKKQVDIAVHSGKNRVIRRLCSRLNLPLKHLDRIAYGQLKLGKLKRGEYKQISARDRALLMMSRTG